MARCPYLDYESHNIFGNSDDEYICKVCGKHMRVDDLTVKFTCKPDYGEKYRDCPIYKSK